MSAAIKQMCRNRACKVKLSFNCAIYRPFSHDIRHLSYFNGNTMQSLNNSMKHCSNGHSSHSFCNDSCHCSHSKLTNHNMNSLNHMQMRLCSNRQRDDSSNAAGTNNDEENEQENQNTDENNNNNEGMSDSDVSDSENTLEARITELEGEAARWKDTAARAQADLFNFHTMSKKDIDKARKFAVKKFSKDILNVADALRGAVDTIDSQDMEINDKTKPLIEGVKLTQRTLLESFAKNGITLMECDGQDFDPNYHEALFQVPTTEHAPNTIVQVVSQGYEMHDIVLRPAKVGIAIKPVEVIDANGDDAQQDDNGDKQDSK